MANFHFTFHSVNFTVDGFTLNNREELNADELNSFMYDVALARHADCVVTRSDGKRVWYRNDGYIWEVVKRDAFGMVEA